jgi:hypothetical protein
VAFSDKLDSDIAGFIESEAGAGVGKGFVSGMMEFLAPHHERKYSVEDFHEKNQRFLKNTKKQQLTQNQAHVSPRMSRPKTRSDAPPRSRGGHRRLSSIENDEWGEDNTPSSQNEARGTGASSPDVTFSREVSSPTDADERTSLLPPAGISSGEYTQEAPKQLKKHSNRSSKSPGTHESQRSYQALDAHEEPTVRYDNRADLLNESSRRSRKSRRKKGTKNDEKRRSRRSKQGAGSEESESSDFSTSSSENFDNRRWAKKRAKFLEKEREKLIAQWKAEAQAEAERAKQIEEQNRWHCRIGRSLEERFSAYLENAFHWLALGETFISNLPLTIGAVAMAVATLGVDWFKFAEETMESCEPVHFHSSQCTFPEFPVSFAFSESMTVVLAAWSHEYSHP